MEYALKKERLYENGNERLRYRVEYPVVDGKEKINRFFEQIGENCAVYCRGELYNKACGGNERYTYVFSSTVTHLDDKVLSVLLNARLFRGTEELSGFLRPLTWDLRTELMMPDKILIRHYGEKRKKYNKKGCFLYNGKLVSISDEDILKCVEKRRNIK